MPKHVKCSPNCQWTEQFHQATPEHMTLYFHGHTIDRRAVASVCPKCSRCNHCSQQTTSVRSLKSPLNSLRILCCPLRRWQPLYQLACHTNGTKLKCKRTTTTMRFLFVLISLKMFLPCYRQTQLKWHRHLDGI